MSMIAANVPTLLDAHRRRSRCWADDCDGCGCGHPGAHPPCGHCTEHGIEVEPCDRCGALTCGCTEERVELRQRARDFPWLVP